MARELSGNDLEKLHELCSFKYKEQAVWFLNAFWEEFGKDNAENVWKFAHKFSDLDEAKRGEGNGLDEFFAHRFLETFNETLTVQAMRDKLRSVGAIGQTERPKIVPLVHYLIWKFNIDWKYLVNAPQGSKEEIEKAQRIFDEVSRALRECEERDNEAAEAVRQSKARTAEAKQREEELRAAKEELEAALAEVKAQEDAYNSKTAELTHLSESGTSMVAKNRAKNELAQHLGEDPLPLRRAKITAEAAVKKADRATQAAAVAREEAAAALRNAEQAKAAAEAAVDEARQRMDEAEAYLEKAKQSLPHGGVWWLERELHEARAYLPASKGGYAKKKVL